MNTLKKYLKKLIQQEWNLGFIDNSLEDVVNGKPLSFKWVHHNFKGRWFADPFILDVMDNYYIILAEDFEYRIGYASISKLIIDKKSMEIVDVKKILDVGSHLSFPVIIRKGEDIFVHPENCVSGKLMLYKYNKEKDVLEFDSVMSNLPLTDAVTIEKDGQSVMLSTQVDNNPNGDILDVLKRKDDLYEVTNHIKFDSNIARMAGDIFIVNGQKFRPAQDCNDCYGGALILQKMNIDGDNFTFETIRRITSTHPKLKTGLHTFNTYKGHIVVDVHGYSHTPLISSFFYKIRHILIK